MSQKVDFNFADLGNQKVKNTLVHAFDVNIDGIQRRELNLEKNDELQDTGKPPTIAVIPFKNMSNDEEQEYFADGVSEDIISNLSSWKSFPVVSRNSSFSFKGRDAKTSEIAKELNANYIVEGSIRKSGNKVRITASLVDGKDEQQVWSKRWDRSLDDIFEVQDEVSQEVAALILPALKGREHERVKSKPPSSFSAWDNYLKGLALFNEHNRDIHIDEVMELCEKAISIDGQFCDAFVLKSRCLYDRMFTNEYSNQRESNEQKFHEVAFAAYGDSSSSKTPPPMLLFNLDANEELRPATLKMKMAYESAKKREKMELMTRTAQRSSRRWSTPFVPFRTRAFNKLLEAKCNEGQCLYPLVYSQDREMHELIIDTIAWRIDVILGKKDAMEHPYAIEQTFDSLMRFYKDSVNAWPICDGRGAMFTFDYTEVHDVEAFYKPYISTTDESDAEKGEGKRYFLHLYRQKILSSFIDNLDAADTEFETVYPIHGKGRIYDRSDSLAEKKVTMIDDTINIPAPDLTSVFETFEAHWSEVIDKFQVQSDDDV